jgi:hypothetical protein
MKQLAPKMASNLLMQFCSGLISEGCQRTLGSILLRGQDEGYSAAEGTASCYILRRENGIVRVRAKVVQETLERM